MGKGEGVEGAAKVCGKCGEPKAATEFYRHARTADGLQDYCKACKRAAFAVWQKSNRGKMAAYHKKYRAANKEKVAETYAQWRAKNPGASAAATRAWRIRNRDRMNAHHAARRASKLRATPAWADREAIRAVYAAAKAAGLEVDHVLPLQGELVSGLHVHTNMQLLSRSDNARKGNLFLP